MWGWASATSGYLMEWTQIKIFQKKNPENLKIFGVTLKFFKDFWCQHRKSLKIFGVNAIFTLKIFKDFWCRKYLTP